MSEDKPNKLQQLWEELNRIPDPQEQIAQRLRARAAQYASPKKEHSSRADEPTVSLLSFERGRERYGLDVRYVRGLRPLERITRVPGVPPFYRGVVNVRGRVLSVLDLQRFFQQGDLQHEGVAGELILVQAQGLYLALLADHISEVQPIPEVVLEPLEMPYTRGMLHGRTVVLDIDALFADERLLVGRGH